MAAQSNLAIVNRDSGELIDPAPARPYQFRSRSHFVVGREVEVLATLNLTALEAQIVFRTMHDFCDGKYHPLDVKQLAADLGRERKNVAVAVKSLVEIGLYIRQPGPMRPACYMVNPSVAFRGPSRDHLEAVRRYGRELRPKARAGKIAPADDAGQEAAR